ncbi:hypothetical protein D3C77_581510 [compost metagenome]
MDGAAGVRGAQQRLQRADQAIDAGEVDLLDLGEFAGLGVGHGRQARGAHGGGRLDPDVQLAEAFEEGAAQAVDGAAVDQVERDQGGVLAGGGEDGVVQLFQTALGAGGGDDVGAGLGQGQGGLIADAAGGADDQGDAVGEGKGSVFGHAPLIARHGAG